MLVAAVLAIILYIASSISNGASIVVLCTGISLIEMKISLLIDYSFSSGQKTTTKHTYIHTFIHSSTIQQTGSGAVMLVWSFYLQ
jgi:hypothetical protein